MLERVCDPAPCQAAQSAEFSTAAVSGASTCRDACSVYRRRRRRSCQLLPNHWWVVGDLTGDHVAERFDIHELLGTGLIGRTYRAWDRLDQRPVALKVLDAPFRYMPGLSGFAGAFPMASLLRNETRLLQKLQHPGICSYHGSGEIDGTPWLAMEYFDAGCLRDRRTPFASTAIMHILHRLAAPLEYLHAAGYVHRDVTPSNIGFRSDGTLALLDLGLAQRTFDNSEVAIQRVMGSPGYSPPECHQSAAFDTALTPRADIFSLGRLIEWMIVGPDMRVHPDSPVAESDSPISEVIQRATRVDPRLRYPDVPTLLGACELALS